MVLAAGRPYTAGWVAFAGLIVALGTGPRPTWAGQPPTAAGPSSLQDDPAPTAGNPQTASAFDPSRYMAPDEIRRGMKGVGRTVMAGTEIQTFEFEVLSVMKNAFEPRQDVILIRCRGLDLENTGVIEGMSGSPCYLADDQGRQRMIGAVAFGWPLSKDPICGVQPITQMLGIPDVRDPANRPPPASGPATMQAAAPAHGGGCNLGELIARLHPEPIDSRSRFSVFNPDIARLASTGAHTEKTDGQIRPLPVPVMVSGTSAQARAYMEKLFDPLGLKLVASGAASTADRAAADSVAFQPGSVLVIPLVTGDLSMEAVGTCTEVIGRRVLGFGHSLFARGSTELPLATGMIHTVFPSLFASFKIGASLKTVGTLWGDEQTGIFGICGTTPTMASLGVTVHDIRGQRTFHYQLARDRSITASLLGSGAAASIFSHNELPDEYTIKYRIQTEFEGLGSFETANFTSMTYVSGLIEDLLVPAMIMFNNPFGEARLVRAAVDVDIEPVSRAASIDRLQLSRLVYKPGDTVSVRIRWQHARRQPTYTEDVYDLALPTDLPDGEYSLTAASADAHLISLRQEKPHKFFAQNIPQILESLNYVASFPQNRLYLRLMVPRGGLAVGRNEMPDLPSFQRQILLDAQRRDIEPYVETIVTQHETAFAVNGSQVTTFKVSRKTEY